MMSLGSPPKIILMTRYRIGFEVLSRFLAEYNDDLALVVTTAEDDIFSLAREWGKPALAFSSEAELLAELERRGLQPDLGVMFWWPLVLSPALINYPRFGFINTHPSRLPYDAGAMSNFWTLVDDSPYGVTIHQVTESLDRGPIIAQRALPKSWEDTDETLYHRSLTALKDLFFEIYPAIRTMDFKGAAQEASRGSRHTLRQTDEVTRIDLEASCQVRSLLNLLRARSYPQAPGCWFEDGGERFEVRVSIKKLPKA